MEKPNIDLIQKEIERKKREKPQISTSNTTQVKNKFLNDLVKSLNEGVETESVAKIKKAGNESLNYDKKRGYDFVEDEIFKQPKTPPTHFTSTKQPIHEDGMREEQMYQNFKKPGQGLGDALSQHVNSGHNPNYNTSTTPQQQTTLNEGVLKQKIQEQLDGYLASNVGEFFDGAVKNVVIEHFTKSRIKEVLLENKELFKEVVIDVIKELRKKSK